MSTPVMHSGAEEMNLGCVEDLLADPGQKFTVLGHLKINSSSEPVCSIYCKSENVQYSNEKSPW